MSGTARTRPRVMRRLAGIVILALVGALALAFAASRLVVPASVVLEESGVQVEVRYVGDDRGEIVAVFRPLQAGFHLYGPDLPRDGIDGAGRPTLLELSAISGWSPAGELQFEPDTTLQSLPSFDRPFPTFPDGPATLRLPIELVDATQQNGELVVQVTYMACSSSGLCLAPVIERAISVPIRS